MGQRNSGAFKGTAQKAVWLFILACLESILTAFPTITLYSGGQTTGIFVEGIALETPNMFLSHDTDASERRPADLMDASWYSRLVEESAAAAVLQNFRGTGIPGSEGGLPSLDARGMTSMTTSIWIAMDLRFTSHSFWTERTAYSTNGLLPWSPRHPAPYR